jgi:hypothetical protein
VTAAPGRSKSLERIVRKITSPSLRALASDAALGQHCVQKRWCAAPSAV